MMAQRSLFQGESSVDEVFISTFEYSTLAEIRIRTRYGKNRRGDKGVPIECDCNAKVVVATSLDPVTTRFFFSSCPYEISDTVALCDEFDMIKEETTEMKKDVEATNKRVESQAEKIFLMEKKFETLEKMYESLNKYL
uniref:Uncharacterized protein At2g07390 n=1 Tax=Arabidopsis thaliana TaxID=3702 RepID=Q9ZQK3_ARATH|nr:hypothetical protein [Arabidopsis thaliana]